MTNQTISEVNNNNWNFQYTVSSGSYAYVPYTSSSSWSAPSNTTPPYWADIRWIDVPLDAPKAPEKKKPNHPLTNVFV